MTRQEAIAQLANYLLKGFDDEKRKDIIDYYHYCEFEIDSSELQSFSSELKQLLVLGAPNNQSPIKYNDIIFNELIENEIKSTFYGVKNSYILNALLKYDPSLSNTTIIGEPETLLPCPCCGYKSLEERANYEICAVCFWEDEGVLNPENFSMANRMSLGEAQQNFIEIGACCTDNLAHIDKEGRSKYEKHD